MVTYFLHKESESKFSYFLHKNVDNGKDKL